MKAESTSIKKEIFLLVMGIVVALYTIQPSITTGNLKQVKLQNMVMVNDLYANR
jgi:hypothetical protein